MIPNQILFLLLRLYNLAFNNISYLQRKSCVMGTLYTPTSNTLNYKSGHYPNAAESIILLGFFFNCHQKKLALQKLSLREKCPNTELFLVLFSCIRSECRKIRTRNNSVFGQFSRSIFETHSL